ncbi:precorrin-2 dehydrogenase/sirohydrochlorin ferrochelatase family protein [Paenibacillus aestuarii]|uniref:precorrin-2 dehydrogenase n=1 Tax=Paenibacillus aestuarii TaxID=516965 RepID=A0ABW0K266_9BACL|nr:bifunctional precorrin-2 dehydrogenase/sirohydrochlorin ferrochelatase [Paenibacillus aestuarii]
MKHPYPIMLDLIGTRSLVVGGGRIAERKVRSLVQAGAHVTVLSPDFTDGLVEMGQRSEIKLIEERFSEAWLREQTASALKACRLVIAATDSAEVNQAVCAAARRWGMFVNVVDQPELSTFILPSVVRRGKLVIAVSSGGASPSFARKIARELEQSYGEEYELYLDFLSEFRLKIQAVIADKQARQQLFQEMLAWDVLPRIRAGTFADWKDKLFRAFDQEPAIATIRAFGRGI